MQIETKGPHSGFLHKFFKFVSLCFWCLDLLVIEKELLKAFDIAFLHHNVPWPILRVTLPMKTVSVVLLPAEELGSERFPCSHPTCQERSLAKHLECP